MASRKRHRPTQQPPSQTITPTYTSLASLRDNLRSTKKTERQTACKQLLEKLQDKSTLKRLEHEAQQMFDTSIRRGGGGGGTSLGTATNIGDGSSLYPRDRVSSLFRNLMESALIASQIMIDGGGDSKKTTKTKRTANQTGLIKKTLKFTANDILFPYRVFLKIDEQGLEVNDGGYGSSPPSWELDWKTRPRYGHHLDTRHTSSSSDGGGGGSGNKSIGVHHGVFSATYYTPHTFTNDDRGTRLSTKEILACVDYCIQYMNDDDCAPLAEAELLKWLGHLCSRVDYVSVMPMYYQVSHILEEVGRRIGRTFEDGSSSGKKRVQSRESLNQSARCLSALVYNLTTRLGMGMQIYTRPVIEVVGVWADDAWRNEGGVVRSEQDIIALMPYLYSAVTHLLAAHPEQSIAVLSEHGHALLRLARRYYTRVSVTQATRDALTDYIGAHLLVAETSGRLCGLPEGDLGPLEPRDEEDDSPDDDEEEEEKDFEGEEGPSSRKKQRKKRSGATLDGKTILSLLDMIRNEKVWEAMFSSGDDGSKKRRKKSSRRSFPGGKKGITGGKKSPSVSEGGATWTPLNRRQRRYLELLARLIRVSQRLYLSEAEDVKEGSIDSLELLIEQANDLRDQPSIEKGEIDIERDDDNSQPSVIATPDSLACSPWIRMVCRHLYNLNPKLGKMVQSGVSASLDREMNNSQSFTQHHGPSEHSSMERKDDMASMERLLFESCPMLQALTVETAEETALAEPTSTYTASTFTQSTSFLPNDKVFKGQDSVRPTATATLQLLCASAESFPRGECWTSSARSFWSTVLDDRQYPNGISANVLERYGSSPADAAAVIYLLGTTLESFGGTGGDESVQLWTLMALLKMTESSAIICSREGLDSTSFGSPSALRVLRVAWQYVWKVLFRYDLRYAAYTQGAYDSNAGELVLQLLTQMIRYNCADRMTMFSRKPSSLSGKESATSSSPFVHAEQGHVYKLPIFDETSTILSSAPFELITAIIEHVGFSGVVGSNTDVVGTESSRDLSYFLSLFLRFFESSMIDEPQSHIQRSFFPFVSMCLASLLSNGGVATNTSTYELDGLTRFGITEDVEPSFYRYNPDGLDIESTSSFHWLLDALWAESIGYDRVKDADAGFSRRILQGRGALLNKFLDASYERDNMQFYQTGGRESSGDSSNSASTLQLGSTALQKFKALFDAKIFQVKYDGENSSDEENEKDTAMIGDNKPLVLPQLTSYLSFILTAIISKNLSSQTIAKDIADVFKDMFMPAFDVILASLPSLACRPADRVAVLNHLNGIVRVLVKISAVEGDGESAITLLFGDQAKSFFKLCKFMLKEHRKETYTSPLSPALPNGGSRHDYESDDDVIQAPIQRTTNSYVGFDDDSDGMMDDDDDMPSGRSSRERVQHLPPSKRRRVGQISSRNAKKDSSKSNGSMHTYIDARSAFSCASLMVLLQPSFQCLELIAGHLVWPDEYDGEAGYVPISKSPDPYCAMVCVSLFCQKSVVLRRDRLLLTFSTTTDVDGARDEDQTSALILCADIIFQARRHSTPSSKYFMCGLGIAASLVEIREYGDCCRPINPTESKAILDVLYPEGIETDNEDYRTMRQWKKILKLKSSYNAEKLRCATLAFLFAKTNLHEAMDESFSTHFVKASLRNADENIRELAPDAVGAALDLFSDSTPIVVSELERSLPKIYNPKKFEKWRESLSDPRLPDNLTEQDLVAMDDAVTSFEFHYIESIGLMAGASKDASISRDMIWKLIELAYRSPALSLLCLRALKRASFLLGYNKLNDLFDETMPHLLVKWLETRRSLHDMPLLLTSPFALERTCRYFPVDISSMLLQKDGWDDGYFTFVDTSETLKERVFYSFVQAVTDFLIPSILLSASEDDFDSMTYLSECALILTDAASDESIAKVLRREIAAICGYIFIFYDSLPNESDSAMEMFKRCVSPKHIEKDGAKNAHRVLRHMLVLRRKGVSVVGSPALELDSKTFIDGMKMISKQLQRTSRSGEKASFLEYAGSSMTECVVIAKYWLSSSLTIRQREDSWRVFELLCTILKETLHDETISYSELGFALNAFITVMLDQNNSKLLPSILDSLKSVLESLFHESTKTDLVEGVLPTLRKLCLALLQVHERTFLTFYSKCNSSLTCLEFEQRSSKGLLEDSDDMSESLDTSKVSSERDELLKHLIESKVAVETTYHETLMRSFESVAMMARSGKMSLKDILGAQDMALQLGSGHNQDLFREVNQKYSMASLFSSTQRGDSDEIPSLHVEVQHFLQIMNEYPISVDSFRASLSTSSTAVLQSIEAQARLLALRRLEKSLVRHDSTQSPFKLPVEVHNWLMKICYSLDPEESRLVSSRCLGEINSLGNITTLTMPEQSTSIQSQLANHDGSPYTLMMTNILTSVGGFLVSGCAETSLVAMKTARALLSSGAGKECWKTLSDTDQALFRPFVMNDEGQQHTSVLISDSCKEKLKDRTNGLGDGNLWCFSDGLWNLDEYSGDSRETWIKNIVCAIISCCLGKDSKVRNKGFFRICQGMCAKEACFAAEMFPYLIFSLLDADPREACKEKSASARDLILSQTAIGTASSRMNVLISKCFSSLLKLNAEQMKTYSQAIDAILSSLDWLKSITEHRFLTADHQKNIAVKVPKNSKTSKKRRSKGGDVDGIQPSPQWRGCLYGVVLRLDGVDVAKACFHAKRYFSAMYYAEMGMQNMVGSGSFFEQLSGDYAHKLEKSEAPVCDISGFGVPSQNEHQSVLDKSLVAKDIIVRCLTELEANDELNGVLSQGAALSLKQNISSLKTLGGLRNEKLAALQDHDIRLEESPAVLQEGFESITSCLEDLGLNHTKHHYLIGVEKMLGADQQDDSSRNFLREKWFEDSLNTASRWDDSLLPRLNESDQFVQSDQMRDAPPLRTNAPSGFYESVNLALLSLEKGDIVGGLSNVTQARRSILADMEALVGSESQLKGMATHLSRLSVIGNLELTARTLEGKSPVNFLLNRWGFRNEAGVERLESLLLESDNYSFDMKDHVTDVDNIIARRVFTEFSVQETQLKLLIPKFESDGKDIAEALTSHVFKSSHIYRDLGRTDAANLSLSRLRSLVQVFQQRGMTYPPNLPLVLHLEDAKLMKCQNDLDTAVMRCKIISSHLDSIEDDGTNIELNSLHADSLLLGSLWMAEQNVDAATTILSSFQKAADLSMKVYKKAKALDTLHSSCIQKASIAGFKLGEFAASLYYSVDKRMSSEAWKKRCLAASERKKELDLAIIEDQKLAKRRTRSDKDEQLYRGANAVRVVLEREASMDDREMQSMIDSLRQYLRMSVESYCSALKLCPSAIAANVSSHVFQLVSLWFKNCTRAETNDIVNELMRANAMGIPSYRFVPLTYQLFSRIDSTQDEEVNDFQSILRDMVLKICSEHPYHGIVQLVALANGKRIGDGVDGRNRDVYLENVGGSKVDAAMSILDDLRKRNGYIPALVESYTTLSDAFIGLAMLSTKPFEKRQFKGLSFSQFKLNLDTCFSSGRRGSKNTSAANKPVIFTNPPPIRPDTQYGDGITDPIGAERVLSFESKFDLTPTGLHRPKIVVCNGSKGGKFKQLVKGEDDLRQDAIMEQVFGTVNDLLRHEGAGGNNAIKQSLGVSAIPCSSRHLRLITYGITPLTPSCGVLEWVNDTMCFGDYVEDKRGVGAHSRYNPGEWGNNDCRKIYGAASEDAAATDQSRRKVYKTICENFSPAFRFFFLEYFNSSMEAWHTARTAYTRSCAVNSIVGHILGIGDRHTSNILVHTKTGEVVHIDFGFVFEQGKTLSFPELVPFRLTRDIVDGMGPSGTDGVFFKAAEATLGVLRNNSDTLLTILSAVVSDPLYKWSISPQKARQLQQEQNIKEEEEDDVECKSKEEPSRPSLMAFKAEDDENRNDAAARAISKITNKLQGYEDSSSFDKSVAGQVKLLINEARDPDNLALMFGGWAPWL